MSTVCLLAQANNVPEHLAVPLALGLLILTAVSPMMARAAGVFRKGSVDGPVRHAPSETPLLFLLMLFAAVIATIMGMSLLQPLLAFLPESYRTVAAGMLGTGFGFLAIVIVNAGPRREGLRLIGLTGQGIVPGLVAGLAGVIVVLPWLFWLMFAAQLILEKFNVHTPTEHEIFRMWQKPETPSAFRVLAMFAAVILAPLAEEAVFRGVLQSGLDRLFARRVLPAEPLPPAATAEIPPPLPTPSTGPSPVPVLPYVTPPAPILRIPTPGTRWLAIILTSVLFAVVHQPWFIMPPIFLLSLGLGYLYERTGNLWAPIFMHMFFNGAQFTLFLFLVGR